jgi:hypothetical protein
MRIGSSVIELIECERVTSHNLFKGSSVDVQCVL